MLNQNNMEVEKTRQERREEHLLKRKRKIQQHGRSLGRVYKNAVLKRRSTLVSRKNELHDNTTKSP